MLVNYDKVHYDTKSDVIVLKVMSKESTYTRAIQGKWLSSKVTLTKVNDMETKTPMYAFNAGITHRSLKGLDPKINPFKPPRNYGDAMNVLDKQAWAVAAYNSEYLGFKQPEVFKLVKPAPGVRIHDTLTRLEYKKDNVEFLKCKLAKCVYAQEGTNNPLESASTNQIYMIQCSRLRKQDCCWPLRQLKVQRS